MRWRKVKQNRINKPVNISGVHKSADVGKRAKAFLVDMFMINMPILYVTVYLILDGKEAFLRSNTAIFSCTMVFGLVMSIFLYISAQTPGYRAYGIKLVNADMKTKVGFLKCFWRFLCFIVSGASFIGLCICFFRKDGKNLHDLLSGTVVMDA